MLMEWDGIFGDLWLQENIPTQERERKSLVVMKT